MSDLPFSLIFIVGCFFFVKYLKKFNEKYLLLASGLFVGAALLRLIGVVFFFVEILIIISFFIYHIFLRNKLQEKTKNVSKNGDAVSLSINRSFKIVFSIVVPWSLFFLFLFSYNEYFFGDPLTFQLYVTQTIDYEILQRVIEKSKETGIAIAPHLSESEIVQEARSQGLTISDDSSKFSLNSENFMGYFRAVLPFPLSHNIEFLEGNEDLLGKRGRRRGRRGCRRRRRGREGRRPVSRARARASSGPVRRAAPAPGRARRRGRSAVPVGLRCTTPRYRLRVLLPRSRSARPAPRSLGKGRYTLLEQLGNGGIATVWRALDSVLGVDRAVKLLDDEAGRSPVFRSRFLTEARVMARLEHPNILRVYDYGHEHGRFYLVMELVDGGSVAGLLRATRPLPEPRALRVCFDVLKALAAVHHSGTIHRDVKQAS